MSIHTVVGVAGRRVVVQPSKLDAGMVTITIVGADRQHLCAITLTPSAAAVMAQALEIEAQIAEKMPKMDLADGSYDDVNAAKYADATKAVA